MPSTKDKLKVFRPRGIEADGLKYYQEQDKVRVPDGFTNDWCKEGICVPS